MNYGFEIVCALIFTVVCIIFAKIYSLINEAYTYWDKKKVKNGIPSYVLGSWSRFSEQVLAFEDCVNFGKYGKVFGTYDGLTPNLLVTDPELIREVLGASSEKFQDVRFAAENSVILKDSLLSLSAKENPEVQALLGSLLNSQKLEKLLPNLKSTAEALIDVISKSAQDQGQVNISSAVSAFVEDVIAQAIFGIELNADVQFKDKFVKNTSQILKVKSPKSIMSILPYLYGNRFKDQWILPKTTLQFFVNLIISKISESSTQSVLNKGKASSLIEVLMEAANEEKQLVTNDKKNTDITLTDNIIISKCIASMLSLANLTRTTVVLGTYALANDKEVQEKLFQEIKENKNEITYDNIKRMSYLDSVVKEIMRLYPFEFRLERVTTDNVKLGEIELEKKTRVSIPLYPLHRQEEYFVAPDNFSPDRFSRARENNYTYLPYGQAGLNGSDIGLQLGVLTAKVTLFKLIEKFEFSIPKQLSLNKLFQKGFTRIPIPENIEVFAEVRV